MCGDHPEVQALIGCIEDRRIITYGGKPAGRYPLHGYALGDGRDAVLGKYS